MCVGGDMSWCVCGSVLVECMLCARVYTSHKTNPQPTCLSVLFYLESLSPSFVDEK